jgi:hypothetical protein
MAVVGGTDRFSSIFFERYSNHIHVNNEETQLPNLEFSGIKLRSNPVQWASCVVSLCAAVWAGSIKGKKKLGHQRIRDHSYSQIPKESKTKYSIGKAKSSVQVQCMISLSMHDTFFKPYLTSFKGSPICTPLIDFGGMERGVIAV